MSLLAVSTAAAAMLAACEPVEETTEAPQESSQAVSGSELVEPHLLEIKFRDSQRIRLRRGQPTDVAGHGLTHARARALLQRVSAGAWMRSHDVDEEALDALRQKAEQRTGKAPPDLNLYFRLRLPEGLNEDAVAEDFRALPEVEAVSRVPVYVPNSTTPDFNAVSSTGLYQRYMDAAPDGVGARGALANRPAARGAGVKICDVEFGFHQTHEDLPPVTVVPDGTPNQDYHGTSILSIMVGKDNGYGVKGIAPDATALFASLNGRNGGVAAAVTACAASMSPGDIILIEVGYPICRPRGDGTCLNQAMPVEYEKATYDAIQTVVGAGYNVIETASNSGANLDDPYYVGNQGHLPFQNDPQHDSGAVMVGGGMSPYQANSVMRQRSASGSNYGSRLNVQGWYDSIVAAGYPNHYGSVSDPNTAYTRSFGGTSGSGAMIASVAASLQSYHKHFHWGTPLTPQALRYMMIYNSTPEEINSYAGPRHIGHLPNLEPALSLIEECIISQETGACL